MDNNNNPFKVMNKPLVELTEAAANKVRTVKAEQGEPESGLRIYVQGGGCSGFQYGMNLDLPQDDDHIIEVDDLQVFVDPRSMPFLQGSVIDFVNDSMMGEGFKVENPNSKGGCGCGKSFKA